MLLNSLIVVAVVLSVIFGPWVLNQLVGAVLGIEMEYNMHYWWTVFWTTTLVPAAVRIPFWLAALRNRRGIRRGISSWLN